MLQNSYRLARFHLSQLLILFFVLIVKLRIKLIIHHPFRMLPRNPQHLIMLPFKLFLMLLLLILLLYLRIREEMILIQEVVLEVDNKRLWNVWKVKSGPQSLNRRKIKLNAFRGLKIGRKIVVLFQGEAVFAFNKGLFLNYNILCNQKLKPHQVNLN